MRLSLFLLDVLTTISVRTCSKALMDVLSKFFIHHDNCYNMRAHFPYIQPVSLSLELLHKRLLSASSNPKLGCLSDLIGYALFVVLSEVCVCVCVRVHVRERKKDWCWSSDGISSPDTHRDAFNSYSSLYLSDFNIPLSIGSVQY